MNKPLLLALLFAATITAALVLLRPVPDKSLRTSGVYADDWIANCGSLQGRAQAKCTARLDAAYGRAAGNPLPSAR